MKAFLELGGAGLSLAGVIIGVYGTYLLTKWTHPLGWWAFNWSVVMMALRKVTFQDDKIRRVDRVTEALSKLNEEDKAESLDGLHWVFLGFIFQTAGAALLALDALLHFWGAG